MPSIPALAAYYHYYLLLCWCVLLVLESVAAQQAIPPACPDLGLRIRSSQVKVVHGESILLAAKLANKGARTLSGVGVRLDLPAGLVAEQGQKPTSPFIVNGGSTAFWRALTLKPGKRRTLKVKARACGSAALGSFPLGGAVYLVNATNDVICLSKATSKPAQVKTMHETIPKEAAMRLLV